MSEAVGKVPQLVSRCMECGKKIFRNLTLLDTTDNVVVLCYDCYVKLKKRSSR